MSASSFLGLGGESLATRLTELESENATLERANAELERVKGRGSSGVGGGVTVDSLEATSKALQGQMLAAAKVQAAELTALWLQVTESKSAAAAGFSSWVAFSMFTAPGVDFVQTRSLFVYQTLTEQCGNASLPAFQTIGVCAQRGGAGESGACPAQKRFAV